MYDKIFTILFTIIFENLTLYIIKFHITIEIKFNNF